MDKPSERTARRQQLANIMVRNSKIPPEFAMSLSACCRTQQHAKDVAEAWDRQGGRCTMLGFYFEMPKDMDDDAPLVPFYSTHHKHIVCRIVAKAQGTIPTDVFRVLAMRVFYVANRAVVGPTGANQQNPRDSDGHPGPAGHGHGHGTDARSMLARSGPVRGGMG